MQRNNICEDHSRSPQEEFKGRTVRWCQQCCTFQPLQDFDGIRRTCRKRLAIHNLRRKKNRIETSKTPDVLPDDAKRKSSTNLDVPKPQPSPSIIYTHYPLTVSTPVLTTEHLHATLLSPNDNSDTEHTGSPVTHASPMSVCVPMIQSKPHSMPQPEQGTHDDLLNLAHELGILTEFVSSTDTCVTPRYAPNRFLC